MEIEFETTDAVDALWSTINPVRQTPQGPEPADVEPSDVAEELFANWVRENANLTGGANGEQETTGDDLETETQATS